MSEHTNELRCFCSRQPLLATFGLVDGELFVHIKVYKQHRIFGEVVVRGPHACTEIRCRECLRWQRIIIRQPNKPELQVIPEPKTSPGNS